MKYHKSQNPDSMQENNITRLKTRVENAVKYIQDFSKYKLINDNELFGAYLIQLPSAPRSLLGAPHTTTSILA